MSIIGTIRNKFTWLLIGVLALCMLAFLLMDSTASTGGQAIGANKAVGKLEGGKITAIQLQEKVKQLRNIYPNTNAVPDEQIQTMAWNELIDEKLFSGRYNDLGINVTKQEMADMIKGENPHPFARQVFASLSETGQYDQFRAIEIVDDPTIHPQGELAVTQLRHAIANDLVNQKYSSLLSNAVNTPTWMAENDFVKEYKTVNFDYVFLPFSLVEDNEIQVTDADLIAYAKTQNGKYDAKDGVILQYVPFDQVASKKDTINQQSILQSLRTRFSEATNPELFATSQSTSNNVLRYFPSNIEYQTVSSMRLADESVEEQLTSASIGDIVGPYKTNGELLLAKVLDKKRVADSASVRHILISPDNADPNGYEAAKSLADSLATILKSNKSKFVEFVTTYSADTGSKANGGSFDFFPQGQMVPEFNDYSFSGKIGAIEVVETNFGFHIVEPLARKGSSDAVKLAPIMQTVKPSKETRDDIYTNAKEFERIGQSAETFETEAANYGGIRETSSIPPSATTIPAIGQSYEMLQWLNNSSVGTVRYFNNVNGKSYVARVKAKTQDGEVDLNRHRAELTTAVRNQKKAVILRKRIADQGGLDGGVVKPLPDLATSIGRNVQTATDAKFGGSGTGIGLEPELISSLFLFSEGKVDKLLEGRRGIYAVDIKSYGDLPAPTDLEQYKTSTNTGMANRANINAVRSALIQSGKIKDERYKARGY